LWAFRCRVASFDTSVFFWQNSKGEKKWGLTDEKERNLLEAWGKDSYSDDVEVRKKKPKSDKKKKKTQN